MERVGLNVNMTILKREIQTIPATPDDGTSLKRRSGMRIDLRRLSSLDAVMSSLHLERGHQSLRNQPSPELTT